MIPRRTLSVQDETFIYPICIKCIYGPLIICAKFDNSVVCVLRWRFRRLVILSPFLYTPVVNQLALGHLFCFDERMWQLFRELWRILYYITNLSTSPLINYFCTSLPTNSRLSFTARFMAITRLFVHEMVLQNDPWIKNCEIDRYLFGKTM